jgi:uncharacterized protein (TIGR02300 family)
VAKPELGTKRLCGGCGAKFYDLNKVPIICPKCETVFEVVTARARPEPAARAPAGAVVAEAPETQEAEFVSLEEADAEAQGKTKVGGNKVADDETEDDDIELDESLDDAAFIEEDEEGDDDVTDIIGDVDKEEDT